MWLSLVIPTTWEAKTELSQLEAYPGKNIGETPPKHISGIWWLRSIIPAMLGK
jgi:hypothetical protein